MWVKSDPVIRDSVPPPKKISQADTEDMVLQQPINKEQYYRPLFTINKDYKKEENYTSSIIV